MKKVLFGLLFLTAICISNQVVAQKGFDAGDKSDKPCPERSAGERNPIERSSGERNHGERDADVWDHAERNDAERNPSQRPSEERNHGERCPASERSKSNNSQKEIKDRDPHFVSRDIHEKQQVERVQHQQAQQLREKQLKEQQQRELERKEVERQRRLAEREWGYGRD